MNRHLIVVSVDAMVYEDLALLSALPNAGRLMREGSLVENVLTIYPALTHPIHAALMSGCAAAKTGVPANEKFMPGVEHPLWYNRMEEMHCDTIFHAAHRAGMTTCACRWPVTAGGFDVIDYLVPEIMDADAAAAPDLETLYKNACSPVLFEDIIRPNLPKLNGPKHPSDENFAIACACEIIRKHKPNLLMTHPCMVDSTRHNNGLFNDRVDDALRMTDEWIGMLMQAVEDAGIAAETSFCIVSDHGHLEIRRDINLNYFLRQRGFIQVDENENVTDWTVCANSCDLSAHVYVKDGFHAAAEAALREMCEAGIYGISRVLTADEARERYGLAGDFAFVVESDGYTCLRNGWTAPAVKVLQQDYRYHRSTHGHMPELGPQPPMIVSGAAFKQGVVIGNTSILNEAPTFAAALGLTLPDADGKALTELLK